MLSFSVIMWYIILVCILILKTISNVESFGFSVLSGGYNLLKHELLAPVTSTSTLNVQTRWMEQPLDHFNSNEKRFWMMRYFERLDLWKPNGPIYVFIGGEGEANPYLLTTGLLYDLANETNGALFMSEHRYYGKSIPLKYNGVESLQYLSSKQAMADLAKMIKNIKLNPMFKESKVVVAGGSYPGNLAAWMKLIYPDLIDAALASSAPVLAKKDFYEYLETVSDVYEQYGGPGCHDTIKKIFKRYEELLSNSSGIEQLKKEVNICSDSDLTKEENKQLFVYKMSAYFMATAQNGTTTVKNVKQHCNQIMKYSRVSDISDNKTEIWFWNKEEECYDVNFDEFIKKIKNSGSWLTSWVYQMCSEFSYAISTSSNDHPFTKYIPVDAYYKICSLSFGKDFNEASIEKAVNETNEYYGGLKPNVKNVVFINGDMDPWHRLGILEDLSSEAVAKVIPRSSHCSDLLPNSPDDSEELKETRAYTKHLIKKWIGIKPLQD